MRSPTGILQVINNWSWRRPLAIITYRAVASYLKVVGPKSNISECIPAAAVVYLLSSVSQRFVVIVNGFTIKAKHL